MQDTYVLDAADLATGGTIVPKDLSEDNNDDPIDDDAYAFPRKWRNRKHEWAIKVVNDADQDVTALPVLSTTDDPALDEYDTVDALQTTVSTGSPPDNVELLDSDVVAGFLGVELSPAAGATGTVKVVFQSRRMG